MSKRIVLVFGACIFAISGLSGQDVPTVKKTVITPSSPVSGRDNFMTYCATCHGKDAKGNGPAANALKRAPADLTQLSVRNGGKFPELRVIRYIKGEDTIAAHGSRDMPVWGQLFRSLGEDSAVIALRVSNLVDYLKSIQTN